MLRPLLLFLCRRGRRRTSLVFSSASDGKLSRMFVIDWGGSPHISRPCEVSMGYWSGALLSSSSDHVIKILSTAMSSVIVESELFENFRYTARITSGVSYPASPILSATALLVDWNWRQTLSATRPRQGIDLGLVVCAWRIRTSWRLNRTDFVLALSIFIQ